MLGQDQRRPETLKLTEPGGKTGGGGPIGQATDNSAPPAGSGFAFSTPLQDSSAKDVGRLDAICISTEPSQPSQSSQGSELKGTCTATATVPDGTLALNVGGTVGEDVTGAIVGGTGKYEGAGGSFSSKSGAKDSSEDTFEIVLP